MILGLFHLCRRRHFLINAITNVFRESLSDFADIFSRRNGLNSETHHPKAEAAPQSDSKEMSLNENGDG